MFRPGTLTWVGHRDPLVQFVLVGHRVELAAQHLPEAGDVLLAPLGVAGSIPLPLPCAVLAAELWSVETIG